MTADPHANSRVLEAGAPLHRATLAVVLLHGRGSSATDILHLASAFDVPDAAFLAPQAAGHSLYPLSFLASREAKQPFLHSAPGRVQAIVHSIEHAGLAPDRIVLAGFSQGACLATEFVATDPARLGGLIALTGGLIGPPGTLPRAALPAGALAGMPAFLGSGDPNPHMPWARVEQSADVLRRLGAIVTTRRYPSRPHRITPDEIMHARALLLAVTSS